MHPYLPNTDEDVKKMLDVIGLESTEELFKSIPENLKLKKGLDLPKSKSEIEVRGIMNGIAAKNQSIDELVCFLGAGSYDHYIPSVIRHIVSRSEFYTAYTPYQPEISQGTLQSVFEYQSMMCSLTGMDVSNVSMYDGATSASEAAILASVQTKRSKVLVSETLNPEYKEVLKSYMQFRSVDVEFIAEKDGVTDYEELKSKLDKDTAGVILQYPNFYGVVENVREMEEAIHENKSLLIMSADPIALGMLKSPGELKADIVVGEGQALGQNLNFGGPVLGFMAATTKLMRKMPGRIVGETVDRDGKRAYVLTLQAREQHIRRYKATSNICSDQTLNSIAAAVYMATLGKQGMKEVAVQSFKKAHYTYEKLMETGKYKPVFDKPFFKEFAIRCPKSVEEINNKLRKEGILGGFDLSKVNDKLENTMLVAVTENRTMEDIEKFVRIMEEM
ncbi:aminomethyl-transferring glycine dehydrogenase subunit GcvPA [Proteiniclasticum sp. SCR006]|uniref:Probable glycine dehydrogenase (decarboxylating) subunit 1 n=1 Tax=Proteiniclasticum aestuarii TaxID=2817862 RepID=A0A939KI70_9CLOT|nr:aminomethyl-transferring glycine dehydrogenase subunit GcvPA [Proteiniclasticum aestuarii]MBO1263833.1 aminomethyl-transferring glycine dehydrogenase subunit GcvPA [Proteiniclasticum aestuarii]